MRQWKVKVYKNMDNDFFKYEIGAVTIMPRGVFVILPFYSGLPYPVHLPSDKWGWDHKTLSLIPGKKGGSCSIGNDEYHGHFIIKDGIMREVK